MNSTNLLPRGCGYRKAGGVYAECLLSPVGQPLEHFIVDPPIPVDATALQLPARGNVLRPWNNAWHLFDRVGEQFYPHVADKVEEIRQRGESRRLNAKTLDFSKITRETRLVLLHRRAYIANMAEFYTALGEWPPAEWSCPKHLPHHESRDVHPTEMCAGLWWRDLVEGIAHIEGDPWGRVRRKMPGQAYRGWSRPDGVDPHYHLAIFMILPLTRLAVVRGASGEHDAPFKAAQRANLPVELVDA
jgi:hypothetical protein